MEPATRPAGTEDAQLLGRLLYDFCAEFDTPADPADELGRRFTSLLAREDVIAEFSLAGREVTGFAYLTLRPTPYFDGRLAQLEELYVVPHLRDRGHGTVLLTRVVERSRELGAGEMHINVDEIDHDTRRFYERHGFTNIQPGQDYRMLCYLREF